MFSLINLLNSNNTNQKFLETINILDLGAMLLDDSPSEYEALTKTGCAKVVGFEPVAIECEKLNRAHQNHNMQFLPYFIGDGTEQKFHLTNSSMTASLYEPNSKLLDMFPNLGELTKTVSEEIVETKRLDDIEELDFSVDYIKLDIQGAELQALEGAKKKLIDTLVIQTEVCWVPLYKNQPLFSEIELYLRKCGFLMHKITGFATRCFKETVNNKFVIGGQQQLWSNAVFVRDFTALNLLKPQQLLKMAVILHEVYNSADFALLALLEYDRQQQTHLADIYKAELTEDAHRKETTGAPAHASTYPDDFVGCYACGVEAFNAQDFAAALAHFAKAKTKNANFAPLYYNLGLCYGKLSNINEAIANLNQALALNPDYPEAKTLRDGILIELQERHLSQNKAATPPPPQVPDYSARLTKALETQNAGKLDEAEAMFLDILTISPNDVPCIFSLGGIEHNRKNQEKALAYFERAKALKPDFAPIWFNLGIVRQSLKQFDLSLAHYDKALSLDPDNIEVMMNRGGLLAEMKRHKDALLNYEELLKKDPNNTKALCNRGILLTEVKFHDLAIHTFDRLFMLDPDYDFAAGLLGFAKMHACQWDNLKEIWEKIIQGVRSGKRVCQTLPLTAISEDPNDHLLCARIFGQFYCPPQKPLWNGEIYNHKKIKIAYVSPDLREHPVGHLTTGLFENHDKENFELIAYSLGIDDQSNLQKRMKAAFDQFIDVRAMMSKDIAALIRSMEIDILIDMAGYTADSRTDIFSFKPAPIQINYLGYSSTMGLDYMDYIIADRNIIPEEYRDCYSENVVYMPDTYLPTDASIKIAETTPPREQYGLPATGFIFCSFNHDYKINPATFDVWMRLLQGVPESVLWLMKLNESAERNLRKEIVDRGIDPARIIFATRVDRIEDHLARYRMADLFLDTTPCNAHSTASDVLRAGLPIVTCRRKAFSGRVAAGLISLMGLPELITDSLEEYEKLALKLATNPGLLNSIKTKLAENLKSTRLFDTTRYCRNLEKAYRIMWQKYQHGEAPSHIAVEN